MAHLIIWNSLSTDYPGVIRTIGPHQLASWLSKFGYNVKVIDFCRSIPTNSLIEITEKFIGLETIGIGASTTFWDSADERDAFYSEPEWVMASRLKLQNKYPKLDWILGGVRTHGKPQKTNWKKFKSFSENEVLAYLNEKTNRTVNAEVFDIKNLEKHYETSGLGITKNEILPLELSRGCQFSCPFCAYPLIGKEKNSYIRNQRLIEEELLFNYEKYGTTKYCFVDDTMNESDEKIIALAEIAHRLPFKLEWVGYIRLDLVARRPYSINLLKESGLRSAFIGMESFHPTAARAVGKAWYSKEGKDFLLKLKEDWGSQITMELSFIVGLPGETEENLDSTNQWCIDSKMDSWWFEGLRINNDPAQSVWKSKFDMNSEKYGYRFPSNNDPNYWVSDNWDTVSAKNKGLELFNTYKDHIKLGSMRLCNLGFTGDSFDKIIHMYERELVEPNVKQFYINKLNEFIANYVDYQLNVAPDF